MDHWIASIHKSLALAGRISLQSRVCVSNFSLTGRETAFSEPAGVPLSWGPDYNLRAIFTGFNPFDDLSYGRQ